MLVESRYLTVEQLEKFLGLKRSRIYYLTSNGEIPFIRIGRTLLFDRQELHRWLESKKVPKAS